MLILWFFRIIKDLVASNGLTWKNTVFFLSHFERGNMVFKILSFDRKSPGADKFSQVLFVFPNYIGILTIMKNEHFTDQFPHSFVHGRVQVWICSNNTKWLWKANGTKVAVQYLYRRNNFQLLILDSWLELCNKRQINRRKTKRSLLTWTSQIYMRETQGWVTLKSGLEFRSI